ncbi:MAK10-like protein [Tanacetum coccineum]
MENPYLKHGLSSRTYYKKSLIMASTFGSKSKFFYEHVNLVTRRTIDQSAGGKLRNLNVKESWALLEDLDLYDNESWNDPRDFAKLVKAIALPQDVPSTSDRRLIELKNQVQRLMEAHLASKQPTQINKITTSCEICSGPHDTQYCMEDPVQAFVEYASSRTDEARGSCVNIIPLYLFKKLNIGLLEETDHIFGLADGTKSYPVGIIKEVEVYIGKLKLLNDFYVIDMKKDLETPLLVGRGFLATANVVIDCKMAKISVGEGITRKDFLDCHLPGEWEIARDAELNPFKDTLVSRRMVEFLRAIPINKDKPPKNGDGAWHAKIRLIDPDGEEFTKTLQSIPTTRKLPERESPREIIDLDHFYDT